MIDEQTKETIEKACKMLRTVYHSKKQQMNHLYEIERLLKGLVE